LQKFLLTPNNPAAADGRIHHIRISGSPESIHQVIYHILEVKDPLKRKRHIAGSRL
jgi:hypothetical protein